MSEPDPPKKPSLKDIAARAKERASQPPPSRNSAPPDVSSAPKLGVAPDPVDKLTQTLESRERPTDLPPATNPPVSQPPASLPSVPAVDPAATVKAIPAVSRPPNSLTKTQVSGEAPPPVAKRMGGYLFVGALAIIGVGVFYMSKQQPAGPRGQSEPTAPSASVVPMKLEPAPTASALPVTTIVSLDALDQAAPSATRVAAAGRPTATKDDDDRRAPPPTAEPAPTPAPSATPPPMGSVGSLDDEIKKKMGATGDKAAVVDDTPQGPAATQDKPSQGAIQGAINSVRNDARSCIEGQEVVTRIGLVFQSNGTVQSVSVSGAGAGKAEGCIRTAVMKAKVSPFTAATFSTGFTIRP